MKMKQNDLFAPELYQNDITEEITNKTVIPIPPESL